MKGDISFEERWKQLLDDCAEKLDMLSHDDDRDAKVKALWTDINRLVTIMAVPQGVMPRMRKTLWKMAFRSSWGQACSIAMYWLYTFFPRRVYRNADAQRWFKERLKNK